MDLLELGKKPISDDNPAGEDARSFPEYELLQAEIDKLSSPTASTDVNWGKVGELSQDILATKSKHLLTALYLSQSLLVQQGMAGLAIGTEILKDLVDNFWDTLHPGVQRMRARKNALVWWMNWTTNAVSIVPKDKLTATDVESAVKNLKAIDAFIQDHIEDPPTFNSLIEQVKTLKLAPGAKSSEATPRPAEASKSQPSKVDALATDDPQKLLNAGLDILSQASKIWMNQESLDPRPFLVNRMVAWLPVDTLPPADNGKTKIPPPDPQLCSTLENLSREGRWRDLIGSAESRVVQYLFWLDLSHFTFKALEGLGRQEISVLVAQETNTFAQRLPGIEKLSFSDGKPFANDETVEWLKEMRRGHSQEAAIHETSANLDEEMSDFLKKAKKDIKENKLNSALKDFQVKRHQTASPRDRLFWDMGFCTLFINTKYSRLVVPYLHEILNTITQFRTEEWEPGLAVEALTLVIAGFKKQKAEADAGVNYRHLSEEVINRLSLLNPVKAVEHV